MKPARVGAKEIAIAFAISLGWALIARPGPLSLPFFWDEGDVYAPGARWLATHGLDFTPGHFPDDWSRGHPPLFYLLVALAFRLFGASPLVGHAVMVPFTALALTSTYVLGADRGMRIVGLYGALLLGVSPLFLSMGAQVLPEMPLTALTALALVLFARRHLVAAAVVGVMLVWIKETGVFTPLAISGAVFIEAWRAQRMRAAIRDVAISLSPLAALAAFFVWQRFTAGYFVFPHHLGLLTARPFVIGDVFTVFPSIFFWHGRWVASVAAIAAVMALRSRISIDALVVAILLLVLGNAIFFAKMFWLERYALPAHVGVCLLLATVLVQVGDILPRSARFVVSFIPVGIALVGLAYVNAPAPGAPEQTFAYAEVIESHRQAIARVEALGGDPLVVTTWPLTTEMKEPWLGFAHRSTRAVHPDQLELHPDTTPDVVVVDGGSSHRDELRALAARVGLRRRATIDVARAPALEVWAR